MPQKLIAGNWKMNGMRDSAQALAGALLDRVKDGTPASELLICPPAHLLVSLAAQIAGSPISLGAQDCHHEASGAHTGDLSAPMLADAGCGYVILGHSERRQNHGETDAQVRAKTLAARSAGLTPIVCVGETEGERSDGCTLAVIESQLRQSLPIEPGEGLPVIAYEPVWAIGTGKTATAADVAEVHARVRAVLKDRFGGENGAAIRILYGGSVKPDNAAELLAVENVDGALVGGASLKADDFWAIASACGPCTSCAEPAIGVQRSSS